MDEADGQPELVLGVIGHTGCGICRVVPANSGKVGNTEFDQGVHDVPEGFLVPGWVEPGDTEDAAPVRVDPADHVYGEWGDELFSLAEVGESVVDPVNLPAGFSRFDGHRADHAVDSRGRAAAADDRESLLSGTVHGWPPFASGFSWVHRKLSYII
jgi:hypothetical protein